MRKKFLSFTVIIFLMLIFYNHSATAQTHPNSIYFEAFGNGGLYSINYDRLFTENIGGRIGIMYLSSLDFFFASAENLLIVPVMANFFIGDKHKLELGCGIIYASADNAEAFDFGSGESVSTIGGTATIGYRYQPDKGGFLFRIGFTPIFGEGGFTPSAGISFGYSF